MASACVFLLTPAVPFLTYFHTLMTSLTSIAQTLTIHYVTRPDGTNTMTARTNAGSCLAIGP
jgi:hypothetical protein